MKILLISPGSTKEIYSKSKVKFGIPQTPSLSLATIATPLLDSGEDVRIIDLGLEENPEKKLSDSLNGYNPDYVGITFRTPQYLEAAYIAQKVKDYDNSIL